MKAISFKVFYGRSVYSHKRCIKLDLDMEGYENVSTITFANFSERLLEIIPELYNHQCGFKEELGLVKKLKEGTYLHHLCGHIAIALQNRIGIDVSFCFESRTNSPNCYTIYEYKYKDTGIQAGNIAVDIINSIIGNDTLDLSYKMNKLQETLQKEQNDLETISRDFNRDVPIISITGTNGKTTTTRLIAYILSKAGYNVGMTTTDGIFINGNCVYEGDTTGPRSALMVLASNKIDVAVLETARGGLVREGLAYDLADVAVITNIADDHLGLDGIETMDDLAKAKMLVGEAVKTNGYVVINGDNDMTIPLIDRIKSKVIVFAQDKSNEVLKESVENGGYGIYISKGSLCIENKDNFISLIAVEDIGITMKGALKYNVENAMAACGALIAFGIASPIIKEGLQSFQCNEKLNPGRFNSFDINGVLTILDYGHNIDGYKRVLEGISQIKHNRLIGVIGVPGDRLDRTTLEVGKIAGTYFNYIFIKEDKDRRGRLPGEFAELLRKGILKSEFNQKNLKIVLNEEVALREAMDIAKPSDIVIIFFEEYAPLLKLVKSRINSKRPELSTF